MIVRAAFAIGKSRGPTTVGVATSPVLHESGQNGRVLIQEKEGKETCVYTCEHASSCLENIFCVGILLCLEALENHPPSQLLRV